MKSIYTCRKSARMMRFALCIALFIAGTAFSPDDKITICHMPPGNPGNCHEITISLNALQTHLDHGDKLFCSDERDYNHFLELVHNDAARIIRTYQ